MKLLEKIKGVISFRCLNQEISYEEAIKIVKEHPETALIDVRSRQEFNEGHLNGAISIPVYDINKISQIIKNRDNIIILYCQTGARSKRAAKILADLCYTNVYTIRKGLEG